MTGYPSSAGGTAEGKAENNSRPLSASFSFDRARPSIFEAHLESDAYILGGSVGIPLLVKGRIVNHLLLTLTSLQLVIWPSQQRLEKTEQEKGQPGKEKNHHGAKGVKVATEGSEKACEEK